jgi:hypothetical protein
VEVPPGARARWPRPGRRRRARERGVGQPGGTRAARGERPLGRGGERAVGTGARRGAAGERGLGLGRQRLAQAYRALAHRVGARGRNEGGDHLGEGGEVVARRPAAQLEEIGGQEGVLVEHGEDGAQRPRRRRLGEAGHDARARLPPERHAHAHPGPDGTAQRLRHPVGEEVVRGHGRHGRDLDQPLHVVPS